MSSDGNKDILVNVAASKASGILYLNEQLSDINFLIEMNNDIQNVPANKAILAALSPVFNAMFYGTMKETADVNITDESVEVFKEFLQFFYLSAPKLSMESMRGVVRLADKYDILEHIVSFANESINIFTSDNVCWAFQLAILLNDNDDKLQTVCENYIKIHPKDVFKSAAFLHCERDVLKRILQLNLVLEDELDVLDGCLKWAKFTCQRNGINENQPINLRQQLGDCFQLIRFGAIDVKAFATHLGAYEDMYTSEEVLDIFKLTSIPNYASGIFLKEPRFDDEEHYVKIS